MNTLLEIAYVSGPALFLALALTLWRTKRRYVAWLVGAMVCIASTWSASIYELTSRYRILDSAWYGQEAELIGKLGQPAVRVEMPEGDVYLVYRIRPQPWKIVAVYNTYRGKLLSVTRPDDFSAALDVIKSRSERESRLVKSNLDRINQSN